MERSAVDADGEKAIVEAAAVSKSGEARKRPSRVDSSSQVTVPKATSGVDLAATRSTFWVQVPWSITSTSTFATGGYPVDVPPSRHRSAAGRGGGGNTKDAGCCTRLRGPLGALTQSAAERRTADTSRRATIDLERRLARLDRDRLEARHRHEESVDRMYRWMTSVRRSTVAVDVMFPPQDAVQRRRRLDATPPGVDIAS